MAGIGFRLTKYFNDEGLFSNLKGILFSFLIASGPWLVTVLSIAVISYVAHTQISWQDGKILKAIICYTYAVSLIMFGLIEMPITRYLADKLFFKDISSFRLIFFGLVIIVTLIGTCFGTWFYWSFPASFVFKMIAIVLFVSIMSMWTAMIFLSAAKFYVHIALSFVLGGLVCIVASYYLGQKFGLTGYLGGFTLGQSLIAVLLSVNLMHEFNQRDFANLDVLLYFGKYRRLILVGFFYYAGIWVDKFLFWFVGPGEHVQGYLYTNQYYDTAMFLAYLTIVPAFAIFVVKVETEFYKVYHGYFSYISNKANLYMLEDAISDMFTVLRNTLRQLVKIQFFISLIAWYFAYDIIKVLHLPSMHLNIFQYGVWAGFIQVLFLVINIILLYFEAYKKVLVNYFIFLICNAGFSWITIKWGGDMYYGLGYALASFVTLAISYWSLNRHLRDLNFYTFSGQPLQKIHYVEQVRL